MKHFKIVILISTLALLSLIAVQYYSIKTTIQYNKDIESVSQHSKKLGQIYIVMNLLLDIETSVRGYLLTGVKKFLVTYEYAIKNLPRELAQLNRSLTSEELESLSGLIKTRVDIARRLVDKKSHKHTVDLADLENGKVAMDKVRSKVAQIINSENELIKKAKNNKSSKVLAIELISVSIFTLVIVGLSIHYIITEFKKRIKAEKELHMSLATSEAISRNIDFGIIACDARGNVIFYNRWVANKKLDVLKKVEDFFSGNELSLIKINQLIHGEVDTVTGIEVEIEKQKKIYTVNSVPFQINDVVVGIVLSIIDTTDSTEKMASLVTSKELADLASKAKSDFVAKMSHEIRTPLNAILGVGEILSLSELDTEQERCLEIFKRSATTLNNLVNDILDLSKIEAGKIEIVTAPFSLKNLVNSCASIMDFRASQKGLLFTSEVSGKFDHFIGDEGRIRQIILNLLSNAIKFTEKGAIKLIVKTLEVKGEIELRFIVSDSGRGISEENIGKLFSDYEQEDNTISKDFGGTGLGLSLSRELARLMGGDIAVRSITRVGSEFTFKVILSEAEGVFSEEKIEANFKLNRLKILLVDDNPENRFIVKKYLNEFNITIIEAVDGDDAIEKFKKEKVDLIFMDINMPKKDGLTATREIRQYEIDGGMKKTIIIALSANALSLEHSNAVAAGCDDYLTKPISRYKLISMIQKWAAEFVSKQEEDHTVLPTVNTDEEIDLDLISLVPTYLENRVRDLETMREAFAKKEMKVIAKIVHNIKGTALSYGQIELDKLAKDMEVKLLENKIEDIGNYLDKMKKLLQVNDGD